MMQQKVAKGDLSQKEAEDMMAVKMWPTPAARDWKSGTGAKPREGHAPQLTDRVGGQLNPTWVEWLQGFPTGWTDLEDSETP